MSSDDIAGLARDFGKASGDLARALYSASKDAGDGFAKDWVHNARATSGEHGRHYPNSITSETRVGTSIIVDTGPETGRPQGGMGMGFEFGGPRQAYPHLDGAQALPLAEKRYERGADAAIGFLLP